MILLSYDFPTATTTKCSLLPHTLYVCTSNEHSACISPDARLWRAEEPRPIPGVVQRPRKAVQQHVLAGVKRQVLLEKCLYVRIIRVLISENQKRMVASVGHRVNQPPVRSFRTRRKKKTVTREVNKYT